MATRALVVGRDGRAIHGGPEAAVHPDGRESRAAAQDLQEKEPSAEGSASLWGSQRPVSVRLQEPRLAHALGWIDVKLPSGALVRVLPGVDAVTFACVLALGAELSAKDAMNAPSVSAVRDSSRRGRR